MRVIPVKYRKVIGEMLVNSGSTKTPKQFLIQSIVMSMLVAGGAFFVAGDYGIYAAIFFFVGVFGLLHGFLMLAVEKRARFVDDILPDALQLMAANSRAGYIPSKALMLSARKEFGPLSEAIKNAGKEMLTGLSMDESLKIIPKHIKSTILERTVKLIIEGTRSGGEFAELLEENAENIGRSHQIEKEVRANVTMYMIFIGFAGCIGAPVLYALSTFLIKTINKLGASATVPDSLSTSVPFIKFSGLEISPDFLFFFSLGAIVITTFFGGLIVGSISTGKSRTGIKYIPVMMGVAVAIFFATAGFIETSFGALLPG